MNKIRLIISILVIGLIAFSVPVQADRGDDANRLSKNGKVEAAIEGINITIEYGRPKVKGRTIWGGLVPYDQVWRTGADEATTFAIDRDIMVEGQKLASGKYGLFTVPGKEQWTVIFNKVADQWGAFRYDKGQDMLRVTIKPVKAAHTEEMTFKIEGNKVLLCWEKLVAAFEITAAN